MTDGPYTPGDFNFNMGLNQLIEHLNIYVAQQANTLFEKYYQERLARELGEAPKDTISKFMHEYCFDVTLNMNDTFFYACAQATAIRPEDLPKLMETEAKFGPSGVVAFASIVEELDPIKEALREDFYKALDFLKGYEFWSKMNCYREYHCITCDCKEEREILGAPIQARYTKRKSENGYSIVECFTENGKCAEGTSINAAKEALMAKYKK